MGDDQNRHYYSRKRSKCILSATGNKEDDAKDWPVVSYKELVEAALSRYGEDVASLPFTKWQPFYQEFLSHLQFLSDPNGANIMDDCTTQFVLKNFSNLKKSNDLLDYLGKDLAEEGKHQLEKELKALPGSIKCKTVNWGDTNIASDPNGKKDANSKMSARMALHFFFTSFDGEPSPKSSCVTLVYGQRGAQEEINFEVRIYINQSRLNEESEKSLLNTLKEKWGDDCEHWTEGRSFKPFGVPVKGHTKADALNALSCVASLVNQHVFAKMRTPI